MTAAGEAMIDAARRTLWEAQNLQRITEEFTQKGSGRLVIATTHMYARYVLRSVIKDFIHTHAHVQFVLRQGIPSAIAEWVASGDADIGIRGKMDEPHDELLFLPVAKLERSVIVPKDHALIEHRRLTLKAIAQFPIVTLDHSLEGGRIVADAFAAAGLSPNIVLSAIDADVVKSYVEVGLGVAILLSVAYEADRDRGLRAIEAAHLFGPTTPHVVVRYGKHLPGYMYDFIERLAPQCDRQAIDAAMRFKADEARV